jgi:RHS repeat-associated protein
MCHPLLFIEPLNRLTEANYSNGDYYHYTYDAVGNRLSQTTQSSVTSYLYDNANRLFDVNGVTYTWDDNGNLLSDGTNTYTYTSNKLSSISGENLNVTFQYRCNGESIGQFGCESDRVSQTVNGVTTNYVLDLASPLTQVLSDGTNTYVYGVDRIAQINSGIPEYFLTDGLGSVRQLVDSNGAVILAKSFAPYGTEASSVGNGLSSYGFTGEMTDPTGLIYLRARYYSGETGRFLTKDSWQGDYNNPMSYNAWLYGFANPVVYIDPTGHTPFIILACGVGTNGACESGTPRSDYNNQVPLSPFADWASSNGYSAKYFDYNLHGNKAHYARWIKDWMAEQYSSSFMMVGHSAGADAVVWAAYLYLSEGGNPSKILGVMALDMDLSTDPNHHYTQQDINDIRSRGVPVEIFHSKGYLTDYQPENVTDVIPDSCTELWTIYIRGIFTGLTHHKYLSVDQAGFDKYMKPVLEDWSK